MPICSFLVRRNPLWYRSTVPVISKVSPVSSSTVVPRSSWLWVLGFSSVHFQGTRSRPSITVTSMSSPPSRLSTAFSSAVAVAWTASSTAFRAFSWRLWAKLMADTAEIFSSGNMLKEVAAAAVPVPVIRISVRSMGPPYVKLKDPTVLRAGSVLRVAG